MAGCCVRINMGCSRHWLRPVAAAAILASLVTACGGIEKSADFDRHRYSQLTTPRDRPEVIYFDLLFPAEFPRDDPAAEAARMRWLGVWLTQRSLCPHGFDVSKRRDFDYLEDNPRGWQQRWEVVCRTAMKAG
jgi:hypothetical protein